MRASSSHLPASRPTCRGGKLNGHVKLATDNGLEVLASEATYDGKTGILTVPGKVTFTRGRM